jgi:hypothetical protein
VQRVTDPETISRDQRSVGAAVGINAPFLVDPRNIALFGQHGGIVFTLARPGVYEESHAGDSLTKYPLTGPPGWTYGGK